MRRTPENRIDAFFIFISADNSLAGLLYFAEQQQEPRGSHLMAVTISH